MEPISIELELASFKEHLNFNKRTILSAKFGDGKTFFINKFKEKYKDDYEFITIYPVNYQIADNRSIFEYIKRDILIQMVAQNMIKPSYEIPDSLIFQFFIMQNSYSLLGDLLQILPNLGVHEQTISLFLTGYHSLKWSEKISNIYHKYSNTIHSHDENRIIEDFIGFFSKEKGSPYEIDLITQIIIDNIQWFHKEKNKKVVFIIEDLDRIDPAHLFRILNIFSAHIDRVYQYQNSSIEKNENTTYSELLPNKFGFDNIITVFDYDKTENIFYHIYGQNADFKGYISKFISHQPFFYSINSVAHNYLYKYINSQCNVSILSLRSQSTQEFYLKLDNLSVRDIQKLIDDSENQIDNQLYTETGIKFYTKGSLTKLISILINMGIELNNIKRFISNLNIEEKLKCIDTFLCIHPQSIQNGICIDKTTYIIEKVYNNNVVEKININKFDIKPFQFKSLTHIDLDKCINIAFNYIKGI